MRQQQTPTHNPQVYRQAQFNKAHYYGTLQAYEGCTQAVAEYTTPSSQSDIPKMAK